MNPAPTATYSPAPPLTSIADALALLVEPGGVVEPRAIQQDRKVSSGYFDDLASMVEMIEPMDATCAYQGIYLTLNAINPALLARRVSRESLSRLGKSDATTADSDVIRRRSLPIDIDPVRPSGILGHARGASACLSNRRSDPGVPRPSRVTSPVTADSGNGAHLLYRIDLPNDDESTAFVKGVLESLDAFFSTDTAKVDTANHNAARIWKMYGTVSRKGDATPERQHRRSAITSRPDKIEVVPVEHLRALADSLPEPESSQNPRRKDQPAKIDLGAWLAAHGREIAHEKVWQGGMLYNLAQCPFSDAHTDGAFAIQFNNGAIFAGCKHDSCGGGGRGRSRWREFRTKFEPEYGQRTEPADETRPARQKRESKTAPERPVDPPADDAAVALVSTRSG